MTFRLKLRSEDVKKFYRTELIERIKQVPWNQRQTLRSLAKAVNVPITSLHRMFKKGKVFRVNSTLKPLLTEQNRRARIQHCLSMVDQETGQFDPMYNVVHVDEKWFFLTKEKRKFYHVEGESSHQRSVRSKRFIIKVMFLCAVARPRHDLHRKAMFSGKLGIWPFVTQKPAKRSSRNRARGTLETKPQNVDGRLYTEFMKEKVLPAIREKWPAGIS